MSVVTMGAMPDGENENVQIHTQPPSKKKKQYPLYHPTSPKRKSFHKPHFEKSGARVPGKNGVYETVNGKREWIPKPTK